MNQNLNFAGKIAQFFLLNRPLTILILLTVVFAGSLSYMLTPKQYNPTITLPAFQVTVNYPEASAEEVENFVTRELEEKLSDIPGVDTISSRSIDGGRSIVNVTFHIGENLEDSKIKVQSKLSESAQLVQLGMSQPLIQNVNPENVPIITLGFSSKELNQNQVRAKVIDIMNELKKVEDVANLEVKGGESRALRILLDPASMKLRKVSVEEVKQAIQASNTKVQSGFIKNGTNIREIEVNGTFLDAYSASQLVVVPGVKLQDLAKIEDTYTEKTSFVKVYNRELRTENSELSKGVVIPGSDPESSNQTAGGSQKGIVNNWIPDQVRDDKGEDTVFLSVAKREGSNSVIVANTVLAVFEKEFQEEKYSQLESQLFRNEGEIASKAIQGLGSNLITSVIIVWLVLLLFLGKRSAFVVAVAIPLTLLLVFLFGLLFGETINRITLFALILSLGLLVDSATVVVENIYRHLQKGEDKKQSIIYAVNEVGVGLFLSTLTSVIVFLPTSQVTGMMGEYMGPLSFFVPLALIMSLFVAYVLTPFLAYEFLEVPKECRRDTESTCKEEMKHDFFEQLSNKYAVFLHKILASKQKQKAILFKVFGVLMLVFLLIPLQAVHFKMLPSSDKEQYYIYIDAVDGTDTPETQRITEKLAEFLLKDTETLSVQSFVGESAVLDFNGLFKAANLRVAPNLATLRVNITNPKDRSEKSEKIVLEMRENLYKNTEFKQLLDGGLSIRFVQDPPGPPVLSTLVAKVKTQDFELRKKVIQSLSNKFEQVDSVVDVDSTISEAFLRTMYRVDHQKALASGLTSSQISQALSAALSAIPVSQFHLKNQNELAFIELQFEEKNRDEIQDLEKIFVKNQQGEMVPLLSVVEVKHLQNEPVRYRDERTATDYLTAEMGDRSIVYAVIDLMFELIGNSENFVEGFKVDSWSLFAINYKNNLGEKFTIEWGGEWKMTLENFRDLGLAMILAFILIYAVLVAQFQSFGAPALIMSTIPLAFIGILPGFMLLDLSFGTYLTATTLIGFIALMGIVVNNAILYLEYFDILRAEGVEIQDALVEAGRTRLRPILLTSMTTVLGSLTIAGDPVWSGLAWSIVFGLSLSAILTLGVFPILYNLNRPKRGE